MIDTILNMKKDQIHLKFQTILKKKKKTGCSNYLKYGKKMSRSGRKLEKVVEIYVQIMEI